MRHRSSMLLALSCLVSLSCLALSACGGAGLYGHSPSYRPLSAEEGPLARVHEVSFEDVKRDAGGYAGQTISFFGVVRQVDADAQSGQTRLRLDFRVLQPRNLCADETSSSCRVTVSERSYGNFSALVTLAPGDVSGPDRVWVGSLVRVYGSPTGDLDPDGGPVIHADYYRHWPSAQYVTTASAGRMRR